jgi:hypothetical protein
LDVEGAIIELPEELEETFRGGNGGAFLSPVLPIGVILTTGPVSAVGGGNSNSFKSIRDVFLPRIAGEADRDDEGVGSRGAMRERFVAVGEAGASNRFSEDV